MPLNLKHRSEEKQRDRPRLKLRRKRPALLRSEFERLVDEAVEVTKNIRSMESVDACRLSAKALFADYIKHARIDRVRLEKLRAQIQSSAPGLEHARAALRRMIFFLRERDLMGRSNWSGPIRNTQRLRFLSTEAADRELASIGSSPEALFALGIMDCAASSPSAFGTVDDFDKFTAELAELRARQRELFEKISTSFRGEDVLEEPQDVGHGPQAVFKLAGGKVSVLPRDSAGERLTAALIAQENQQQDS